jgi:hypothetical protein
MHAYKRKHIPDCLEDGASAFELSVPAAGCMTTASTGSDKEAVLLSELQQFLVSFLPLCACLCVCCVCVVCMSFLARCERMYAYIHVYMSARAHTRTKKNVHTHTHTHTSTHTHTHSHTCRLLLCTRAAQLVNPEQGGVIDNFIETFWTYQTERGGCARRYNQQVQVCVHP